MVHLSGPPGGRRPWTALALAAALAPAAASADTFTVTTNADSGVGSLREAVGLANASPAADTIRFALGAGQTSIALASALPDITGDLTLNGPTTDLTIRGTANTDPLMRVASGETVIQELTLDQGTVSIAAGAKLSFDLATDRSLTRDISDAGALEKRGSAKLTLTGTNSYTGGTNVAAGTLQGNVASLPGDLAIASGATLIFDQASSDTKAGVISGSGILIKTGAGTLTLTGANTFTGQTSVSQGILRGSADTLPGSFSISSGATLSFDQAVDATENGAISGAGSVEKLGAGTLTLTGANVYTGGTQVSAGRLRGSAQSIPGNLDLAAGAGVIFDESGSATQAGNISGAGSLTKLGAGTLTLSGSNSYTGGTTLSAGVLRGTTASLQGNIANGATLIFDQAGDGSYAGVISGTGALQKQGAGSVGFSQNQTYTGPTTIAGGTLELLSANLTSDVDVRSAATLAGSGAVGALQLDAGAAVAPRTPSSSTFGTLTAQSATFAGGSALTVRVTESGASDRLVASAAATLQPGARLDLQPGPGSYSSPVSFDVLTAASVSGNFTQLPQFAFLNASATNLGDRIRATLQASGGSVSGLAQTPNQAAVARTLEVLQPSATGDLATVFDSLILLTADQVPGVLDSLSGELVSDFDDTRLAVMRRFDRAIASRVFDLGSERAGETARRENVGAQRTRGVPSLGLEPRDAPRLGAWIDGLGLFGDVQGDGGAADFDYRTGGGALGFDWRADSGVALGAAFGYTDSDLDLSGIPGDGTARSYLAALYSGYSAPRFVLSGSARFGFHDMETSRRIRFGAIDRVAHGDFDGRDYGAAFAGAVRLFSLGAFRIEPTASLAWTRLERSSFGEDGAGSLSLRIEDETRDSLQSGLGLRAHALYEFGGGAVFAPEFFASWLHEFGDTDRDFNARFQGASVDAPFEITGAELPRSSALTGVRWVTSNSHGASAEFSYALLWSGQQLEHSLSLGFHLSW